jgi:hypothetical protein
MQMRGIGLAILVLVIAGCSARVAQRHSAQSTAVSNAHTPGPQGGTRFELEGQFLLQQNKPEHPLARVRLVSIGKDGATVIEHMDTHGFAHAFPGEYFRGAEFGTNRLKLISASQENQQALFDYKWSEVR